MLDLRLTLPAVSCWISAALLITFPESTALAVIILWLAAAAALSAAFADRRRRWRAIWGTVAVCCAAGALAASVVAVMAPVRLPEIVRTAAASHSSVRAVVTVSSLPTDAQSFGGAATRIRFTGIMTSLTLGATADAGQVSVPVLVYAATPGSATTLHIGTSIEISGTLRTFDPGGSTAAQLFGRAPPEVIAGPPWWLAWAAELRSRFAQEAATLPGDGGALLPGLAIGDTSAVHADLDTAMKESSLSHLTAVSGANCVLVVGGIMMLGAAVGLRRGVRIILALAALLGFVVLVTPEASVLRAAVMATIVLVAMGLGRPGRGVPALSLAVIVLLVADPWLSRSYGFTLSVLATGGLLLLSGPLTRALSRVMPLVLAAAIAVPLAAQLACQPVLVLLSPTLPLYGVPANLLAAPAAPAATMVGLLACLLMPWMPGIATALLHLAWLPSAWIAGVAQAIADFPASRLPWCGGLAGVLLTVILTVLALGLALRVRGRPDTRLTAAGVALLIVFSGAYTGALVGAGVGRALTFPGNWQVAACDIGQGDAVVVRDGGMHALVDVGRDPALLDECLHTLGVDHIDLLLLTHYDLDHVGGLDAVFGMVDVALVGVPENPGDERLQRRLTETGADVRTAFRGDRGTLGGLTWRILWPKRDSMVMQAGNDGSVNIEFDGRGIRSLFLADLGEESQRAMQAASPLGRVDVVKVAHHGSGDQSPDLYATLRASVGLITVGDDNGYGHPTSRLLGMLKSAGTTAFRTDRQGMLVVAPATSEEGGLTVWTERTG